MEQRKTQDRGQENRRAGGRMKERTEPRNVERTYPPPQDHRPTKDRVDPEK